MQKILECFGKNVRSLIAVTIVLLSFVFLFMLMHTAVPKDNESIINVAAGLVLGALGGVVGYYFGSSKDKSDQDKADRVQP